MMEEKRHHIRLNTKNCVKITSPRMDLILKAAEMKGVSLSEFCKVAALKEAKHTIFIYRKDRLQIAKKIIECEEKKKEVEDRKTSINIKS